MSIKVEPFGIGDFVHAYNRGNNKEPIFSSKTDYWRFMRGLRFFNDERDIKEFAPCLGDLIEMKKEVLKELEPRDCFDGRNTFEWEKEWGDPRPLAEIISFHLAPNHFHLLLREVKLDGISKLMKKLSAGYTVYRNFKDKRVGRVFQGQYRGKRIKNEAHLQYADAYIQVFNPFELYEGGYSEAFNNFDKAFQFALEYPFCSLGESFGLRNLGIVKRDCLKNAFIDLQIYKEFCKDALLTHAVRKTLGKLTME